MNEPTFPVLEPLPLTDVIAEGWRRLLADAEALQEWKSLTPDQLELLKLGFQAGVNAKADEVQPLVTRLELKSLTCHGGRN